MPAHPDLEHVAPPIRFKRPYPRTERRTVCVAAYGGYLLSVLAGTFIPFPGKWLVIVPAIVAALYGSARLLSSSRLGTADTAETRLDERQLQVRNAAYLTAYRVIGASVILALMYSWIASDQGWWLPRTAWAWQGLFWGGWLLVVTLPTVILAWTEPQADDS